jgi:hypothetical protein
MPNITTGKRVNYWIPIDERLPKPGEKVVCRYEGVYENRHCTFWIDPGEGPHFGLPEEEDGKGSQPATHWIPAHEAKILDQTVVRADPPWLEQAGRAARAFMVENGYPVEAMEAITSVDALKLVLEVTKNTLAQAEAEA